MNIASVLPVPASSGNPGASKMDDAAERSGTFADVLSGMRKGAGSGGSSQRKSSAASETADTAANQAAGIAGAMLTTVAPDHASSPTTSIVAGALASGAGTAATAAATQPDVSAQGQMAQTGTTAQSGSAAGTMGAAPVQGASAATTGATQGTATGGASGAAPVQSAGAAPGDSTTDPNSAEVLETRPAKIDAGPNQVATAKSAILAGAVDPTATGKDPKTPQGPASPGINGAATSSASGRVALPASPALTGRADAEANAEANTAPGSAKQQSQSAPVGSAQPRPEAAADSGRSPAPAAAPAVAPADVAASSAVGSAAATISDGPNAAHQASSAAQARPLAAPGVVDQVAVSISRAAASGVDQITIQLKPESLGRIDVRLELGVDGKVNAVVMADRQDTLDLLQRDSRGLERALNDAGLRTDSGGLSFNLRGDGRDFGASSQNANQTSSTEGAADTAANGGDEAADKSVTERRLSGLVDISV